MHRFDDPLGEYLVRYAGEDLEICLIEVLARFRSKPEVDDVLAGIAGVDDGYGHGVVDGEQPITGLPPHSKEEALREVLGELKTARVQIHQDGSFLDVSDPLVRFELGKHPRVREAIQAFDELVGNPTDRSSQLDGALIRLAGAVGRKITQAASRAVYEMVQYVGIAYFSRWDDAKRCWAIWGDVEVTVEDVQPLNPAISEHRDAVQKAARIHGLPLPSEWS
ncbi:hypothetical protein [Streptomyces europaeiscabiei]|uniref:hypothetical protein n=1 Tax=Streptomyces europaeiscabiei TaxID=146819 RepID=UPI002E10D0FD|nr:hypothetical protein OHB30_51580 [Streptomyces europaeiscabiei]